MDKWELFKEFKYRRKPIGTTYSVDAGETEWRTHIIYCKYDNAFEISIERGFWSHSFVARLNEEVLVILKFQFSTEKNAFSENGYHPWKEVACRFNSDRNSFSTKIPVYKHFIETELFIWLGIKFFKKQNLTIGLPEETKSDFLNDSKVFSDDLSNNLRQVLEEGKSTDVTIHCGLEIFWAHKAVLTASSPVFAAMFQSHTMEAQTNEVVIIDIAPDALRTILTYIYSSQWHQDPEENPLDKATEILAVADKYMLSGLKKACVELLRSSITDLNALDILVLADLYDAGLKKDVLQFVCSKYYTFKMSSRWENLQAENPYLIIDILTTKIENHN